MRLFDTIAFRLSVWFTGIFSVCSAVAFILFYYLAAHAVMGQTDQILLENSSKFSASIQRRGLMGARELAVLEAQAAGEKIVFYRLLYPSGEVFASSHMSYWKQISISQDAVSSLVQGGQSFFETIDLPSTGQKVRVLYSLVAGNVILQAGTAIDYTYLTAFRKVFLGVMGFIIVFSALSGWMLVSKALSNVRTITETAKDISGSNLEARVVSAGGRNELDTLVQTFNSMLDRIEALVKNIREMGDNVAHDLKSPVTKIRGFAELALVHDESLENYRNMAANTIEESDRLLEMINSMLLISRAEAGQAEFRFERLDLSELVKEACELFSPLAEDKQIRMVLNIKENIFVSGDRKMLQRAFANLLDNAIKYTPDKGRIDIFLYSENPDAVLEISDTGPGIPPELRQKIFERFYRIDSSRTDKGAGLGLSFVKAVIDQHQGSVKVVENFKADGSHGSGSVFKIRIPASV